MVKNRPLRKSIRQSGQPPLKDKESDYTSDMAPGRFFYINLGLLRYGTDDKFQGVAIIFGGLLVLLWGFVGWKGFSADLADKQWAKEWSASIYALLAGIVGVAIGRGLK